MPNRIQRRRVKGWKMPEGAVSVTRPGKWGNPYRVADFGLDLALALFTNSVHGIWSTLPLPGYGDSHWRLAYETHCAYMRRWAGDYPLLAAQTELRGHDVACWCPLDAKCHGDLWLEWAR